MPILRRLVLMLVLLALPAIGLAEAMTGNATTKQGSAAPGGPSPEVPAPAVPTLDIPPPTTAPVITNSVPATDGTTQPRDRQWPSAAEIAAAQRALEQEKKKEKEKEPVAPEPTRPSAPETLQHNEFQDFISQSTGQSLPLFGYDLFANVPSTFAPIDQVPVTPDYVIGPGDELVIRTWGQVDIDLRLTVDRNGNIFIPKAGDINVAGIRYSELQGYLKTAIGRVFRNFELNVTLGNLRSIEVIVVGQARRPGNYTVSSLSTLVNTLFASGGPSGKGTMRRIQLKRGRELVTELDLYDLLIKGDKSRDVQLLPGDVIYIPPIGPLVAITGSVNVPAVYELKGTATLNDLLQLAGGLTTTAAGQKVTVERIVDRKARKVDEFPLTPAGLSRRVQVGDLVQVFSLSPRFDNVVTLQGNVAAPARYPWFDGMRVSDLLTDHQALITQSYWQQQNEGATKPRSNIREVNWDYAVVQRLRLSNLTTRLIPFNLGRAIRGDARENLELMPGDIVTIYAADADLPRSENDVVLTGSIIGPVKRRFPWREGMRVRDVIPSARWLADYYDYWFKLKGTGSKEEINWDYANIVRQNDSDLTRYMITFNPGKAVLDNDAGNNLPLRPGDEITIFSKNEIQVPVNRRSKFVRLEGELQHAGVYQIEPGETLRQLIARTGGLTPEAYLYGAEFTRESTRELQQKKIDAAVDRLEREIEQKASGRVQSALAPEDVAGAQAQLESQRALVTRLREVKATGRIVLEIAPDEAYMRNLPDLVLEDGDRFLVPARHSTVSVIGSVYNENAFIYKPGKRISDYLALAGGVTKDGDADSIYVIRADGSIMSKQQAGFFTGFEGDRLMPGDTVVVPANLEKVSFAKGLKDWTQILYQFGLGAAAIKVLQ